MAKVYWPKFGSSDLTDVVVQDARGGSIRRVTTMNQAQWMQTLATAVLHCGQADRPHEKLVQMSINCEGNSLLCRVSTDSQGDMWIHEKLPRFELGREGLVPAVALDYDTRAVLMLAWANQEAFAHASKCGNATYWSRSRNKLWEKGEGSKDFQQIVEFCANQRGDTLLYLVRPQGEKKHSCHMEAYSCYFRSILADEPLLMTFSKGLGEHETLQTTNIGVHGSLHKVPAAA